MSVLRDGKLVEGLQAGDFEVRDNGVLQSVEIAGDPRGAGGGAGKQVDVVLALDVSDSVRGGPLEQLKAAAHALVEMLRPAVARHPAGCGRRNGGHPRPSYLLVRRGYRVIVPGA